MVNLTNLNESLFDDVNKFWGQAIDMKTMEEAGELIQALSKYHVFMNSDHPNMERDAIDKKADTLRQNLIEEIRDMYISLECIKLEYDIDENELNGEIEKKLKMKK